MTDTPNRCEPPPEWRWIARHVIALGPKMLCLQWGDAADLWVEGDFEHDPEFLAAKGYRYVAPVLTPDEIAEREAAAYERGQREMREAVLGSCRQQMIEYRETAESMEDRAAFSDEIIGCKACAAAIAALPIKEKPE